MDIRRKLKGGFTLIELMIVVAIVGVLAVLAVYGVRKYIANAKTAEAKNSLGQIGKDAVTAYEGERMAGATLAPGAVTAVLRNTCGDSTAGPIPAIASVKGQKYQSTRADWANPADVATNVGWPCLRFELTAPQYYSYDYKGGGPAGGNADGTLVTATAAGDLDGNGTQSLFTQNGTIAQSRLLLAPAIAEVSPDE